MMERQNVMKRLGRHGIDYQALLLRVTIIELIMYYKEDEK